MRLGKGGLGQMMKFLTFGNRNTGFFFFFLLEPWRAVDDF